MGPVANTILFATGPKEADLHINVHSGDCVASSDILAKLFSADIVHTPTCEGIMDKTDIADAICFFPSSTAEMCTGKARKGYASTSAFSFLLQEHNAGPNGKLGSGRHLHHARTGPPAVHGI